MSSVTVLHNNVCSTSRNALDTIASVGIAANVVRYLDEPLSRDELLDLLSKLDDEPADLVRKDDHFEALGLKVEDYTTPEQVADLLVERPRLMQRPVIVRGGRAIIGRPADRVTKFLNSSR